MSLFDANCMLGRRVAPVGRAGTATVEWLLAEMDRLGIADALVYHGLALDGHPARGNAGLLDEIRLQPRLHAAWILLPNTGELPPPARLIDEMRAAGVRAARIHPGHHRFDLSIAALGDLLEALEEARIPLFVDFDRPRWSRGATDWRGLVDIAGRHPHLPIVLVGAGIDAPRNLFPIWPRYPNLYLETSYYQVHQGLSEIASRFGPERLLFGTGLPGRAAGPPLAQLASEPLSADWRVAIGGNTLHALLSRAGKVHRVEEIATPPPPCAHMPVLDLHGHLGAWPLSYVHRGDAEGLLESMDRIGIQAMALSAFDAIGPDVCGGNDEVAAAVRRHPGRFFGYGVVDPNQPELVLAEVRRCIERLGLHGLKVHAALHDVPVDAEAYGPALEYANAHGLCVLVHGRITAALLERYPRAQVLAAHAGGWDGRGTSEPAELTRRHANLYLDLAASTVHQGVLEHLCAAVGAERIVYGSDAPLHDPSYQLGRVLYAQLTFAQKEQILYRNARRLFGLAS